MSTAAGRQYWYFALVGLCALCGVRAADAHSGQVALAYPLSGIAVDGDLADWPDHLPRHPVDRREFGDEPADTLDHRAFFRVAYDSTAQALYFAFEVRDQSAIIDSSAAAGWLNTDCTELYVHTDHDTPQAPIRQYEIAGIRLQIGDPRHAQARMGRRGAYRTYEWRLDARQAFRAGQALRPGLVLGIDPVVIDKDADGSHSWMAWSRGARKFLSIDRIGDILLMDGPDRAGALEIACDWADDGAPVARAMLHIEGPDGQRIHIATDERGTASIDLPAGRYNVRAQAHRLAPESIAVDLAAGARAQARLTFAPVTGEQVPAGPGVRTAAGPGARIGAWQNFSQVDGLPHVGINAIFQDRQGYLWLGAEGGLIRYDGQDFLHFTQADGLPHNTVYGLAADRAGHLWIATQGGVARYDGRTFARFTRADGLPVDHTASVLEVDGEIWMGSHLGLTRYDGRHLATTTAREGLVGGDVLGIERDPEGRTWVGADGGLSRYERGRFFNVWTGEPVHDMAFRGDTLWYAAPTGLRAHRDGRVEPLRLAGLDGVWTWRVAVDGEGHLWISHLDSFKRYDGHSVEVMGVADGLPNHIPKAMLEDREGNLWVATDSGLSRYDGRRFSYINRTHGLANDYTLSLLEDREGRMWIGTHSGLDIFDGGDWSRWAPGRGWERNPVSALLQDRAGRIWVGHTAGLSRYDGQRWAHYGIDLAGPNVLDLAADRRGRIWFASAGGLGVYDDGDFTRWTTMNGLLHNIATAVAVDRDDHVWVGTFAGLNRYDGTRLTSYTTEDGLVNNTIDALFADSQGRLWIGSYGGVNVYEDGAFRALATEESKVRVLDFAEDDQQRIWIGTANGVLIYDGAVMQHLLRRDGLVTPLVDNLLPDSQGRVWIGSGNSGITIYAPQDTPPKIVLRDVITNSRLGPVDRVALPTSQPLLAFEFLGLSFKTRTDVLVYRYRLAGHDDRWRTTRSKRVEYRDLPRGAYTFEVQAVDRDLNYSRQNLRVAVEVHPPYRQMALYATLGLAGLLLVASVGRILRSRRELEQRVDERTAELAEAIQKAESAQSEAESANQAKSMFLANMSHEIRTPLNAILGYAQVLQMRPSADPELKAALDAIDRGGLHLLDLINSVLDLSKIEAARAEVESIHFDLGSLVHSLDALFRHQSQRKGLQWQVRWARGDQPLDGAPRAVGVFGDEGKLRQVLVNLLGNAVKFTRAGRVTLDLALPADGSEVYGFAIADTGPGIDRAAQRAIFEPFTQVKAEARVGGTGLGLALASRYVELMGGELAVASAPGQGARFAFELPLAGAEPVAAEPRPLAPPRLFVGHCKVLVAEDSADIQDVMRHLLEGAGLDVTTAGDGETAVARALTDRPEIVFMDIWMPRLDGQTAARRIAQALGDDRPKLVAVTASALEHERQQYRADFDEVLLKPVRADQLYRTIERLLDLDLEHKEQASAPDDFAELVLPRALHSKLCEAVEDGLVTDLKGYLAEVHQLGPQGAALAERLGALSKRFANDDILRILDHIETRNS